MIRALGCYGVASAAFLLVWIVVMRLGRGPRARWTAARHIGEEADR